MEASQNLVVEIRAEVLQAVRQHARSSMKAEVCGVLIGSSDGWVTAVEAHIQGEGAAQGGAHVTFTQATWEHIYKIKDRQFPKAAIVGWYHSHPGFGVFLSEYDLFIHRNFFSNPGQVAWVYDPHSDEEGCFMWTKGEIARVYTLSLKDGRVGEGGGQQETSERKQGFVPAVAVSGAVVVERRWQKRLVRGGLVLLALVIAFLLGLTCGVYLHDRVLWNSGMSEPVRVVVPERDGVPTSGGRWGVPLSRTGAVPFNVIGLATNRVVQTNVALVTVRSTNIVARTNSGGKVL